jgi:hypothetical protein
MRVGLRSIADSAQGAWTATDTTTVVVGNYVSPD